MLPLDQDESQTPHPYIWTRQGWPYLAVILDLYSRRVVGWAMSERIDRHLVLDALDMALKGRQPPHGLLHHSDRDSQLGFKGSSQRCWTAMSIGAH